MRRFKSKPLRSALLAHRALPDGHLAGRERRGRGPALLDVLVGLRFLLFLVAAHLTLGHGVSPLRPVERFRRAAMIANALAFVCSGGEPRRAGAVKDATASGELAS